MRRVTLGNTDLQVSNLCLGTMQFGWTAGEDASFAVMDAFVAAGGNFIDTADIYSVWSPGNPGGVSEEIIGRWMKARGNRNQLVIATKLRGKMWDGPDGEGLSRAHIKRAIEDSLRRLQIDSVDLYQCHWPDEKTPVEETMTVFAELAASGKVRYVGASNFSADQLAGAQNAAASVSVPPFATLQPHYNLVHRSEYESALESLCDAQGIGVIPYSPLEGGFLSGKYRRGEATPQTPRAAGAQKFLNDKGFAVIDALDEVADAHSTTVAATALAWLSSKRTITAPIIGANSTDQLSALLPAGDMQLTDAEVKALDSASSGY
ncbi:MAG: aldo/keto reductase [Dehalococcoidia bacterium]